jgi:hypothetical protein
MKLSELQAGPDFLKLLLLGASGSGKTVNTMTFPGPIMVMDFDNKISSAVKFYQDDKEKLSQIDVIQLGKMPTKGDAKTGRPPRMTEFNHQIQKIYDLQNNKKPLPFKTLVIDTITTLTDSILDDYKYVSQLAIKRPNVDQNSQSDYGLLINHFKMYMTGLLALDCNVVFIGHTQLMKDENTGSITNEILMPGSLGAKLGIYFEEVYFAKTNSSGQFLWQTKPDGKTSFCRTQRKLAAEIPANYQELMK